MKKLWRKLPPPAPDTSGVANALFGMEGLLLFDDVQGCASNYCIYDETRASERVNVFPAQLSDMDVIMGTREQLRRRLKELYDEMPECRFIALAGSPISMLIGTDLKAACLEITEEYGVPAFPIDVTGHRFYDVGAAAAMLAMGRCILDGERREIPGTVNLLGALTMDLGTKNIVALHGFFEQQGLEVISKWGCIDTLDNLKNSVNAAVNVVVAGCGLPLARMMKRKYGIPYTVGVPCGSRPGLPARTDASGARGPIPPVRPDRALIIGEQVLAGSIRNMLRCDYGITDVTVSSFFEMDAELLEPGDERLSSEDEAQKLINSRPFDLIIGDPFYERLAANTPARYKCLPHIAVSSKIYEDDILDIIGAKGNAWFEQG
ncbi:Nitrogenase component 1 type Oxidoreductase [Sporobacter termitidis DSM 10068]|uniref:Nitrogenase component 1 type Oxidoreductase n=1 Tax=Sporobacter termitidis DSM 10068 TaxID=1123282 RepID=A0A1M5XCL4_9FIRM|nr:nitrogenase component 1 [Sporobacter termitidis]SHH97402.1 Nitrogenase component 1 type Oxidoreductase [Sporobacter termitidis DSM 10068]